MTKQLQSETLQFNLYKMYKMTTKTRSDIITKKTRSEMHKSTINSELRVHAYFALNYHLCQNYDQNDSFLTVHKNIKASIHKNAQDSTIVECNLYDTNAIVTDWLQVLSNPLRLFRGLNDCKHYLLHLRQATFYTYREGTK
jgi:hypothetical protein